MSEIYKIQKPICSSEEIPKLLIYNEERTTMMGVVDDGSCDAMFGNEYKIFVKGYINEKGTFCIEEQVEDPGW